jgi:hypothetical protein
VSDVDRVNAVVSVTRAVEDWLYVEVGNSDFDRDADPVTSCVPETRSVNDKVRVAEVAIE